MKLITPIYYKTPKGYLLERKGHMSQTIFIKTKDGLTCVADTRKYVYDEENEVESLLLHKVRYTKHTVYMFVGYANLWEVFMNVFETMPQNIPNNYSKFEKMYPEFLKTEIELHGKSAWDKIQFQCFVFHYENGVIKPYYIQVNRDKIDFIRANEFIDYFGDFYPPGIYAREFTNFTYQSKHNRMPETIPEAIEEGTAFIEYAINLDKKNNNKYVDGPIEWVTMDNYGNINTSNKECEFVPKFF